MIGRKTSSKVPTMASMMIVCGLPSAGEPPDVAEAVTVVG